MRIWRIDYKDESWYWLDPYNYPERMIRPMVCEHLQADALLEVDENGDAVFESVFPHDLPGVEITEIKSEPVYFVINRNFTGSLPSQHENQIIQLPIIRVVV